ncbi:MAG: PilN domain-containing protein [Acidobacteria bacterium]|nr:PilN domain-containing protein [Acidobacteriota bacterium]
MIRVNLLGVQRAKRRVRAPVIPTGGRVILILVVVVLGGVAGLQWWRYQSLQGQIAQWNEQIEQLQREKADLSRTKSEYDTNMQRREQLTHRINVIEALKTAQSGPVLLLDALANTVSATDSLWLTGFEQKGRAVTIQGTAMNVKAVADFLTRLKGTNLFSDMDLKEAQQDSSVRDITSFNFTLSGQLAAPALVSVEPGSA